MAKKRQKKVFTVERVKFTDYYLNLSDNEFYLKETNDCNLIICNERLGLCDIT